MTHREDVTEHTLSLSAVLCGRRTTSTTKASKAGKGQPSKPTLEVGEPWKLRDRGRGLVVHPAVVLLLLVTATGHHSSSEAIKISWHMCNLVLI